MCWDYRCVPRCLALTCFQRTVLLAIQLLVNSFGLFFSFWTWNMMSHCLLASTVSGERKGFFQHLLIVQIDGICDDIFIHVYLTVIMSFHPFSAFPDPSHWHPGLFLQSPSSTRNWLFLEYLICEESFWSFASFPLCCCLSVNLLGLSFMQIVLNL
jgi:hypothetical protein